MALVRQIHFTALGSSRPPLVAIPGGPGLGGRAFLPWLAPLAEARRLVLPDLRGCGEPLAAEEDSQIGLAAWVADIEQLRLQLGEGRVVLLGHSSGGHVALEYALHHPGSVAGLVLVNTAPSFAVSPEDLARMRAAVGEAAWPHFERVLTLQAADDAELNQAAKKIFPLELVRREPERVARMLDGFGLRLAPFRRGLESLAGWSVAEQLSRLSVPTLVVAGAEDWFLPPVQSAAAFAPLPDVEIAIFERCGHLAFVDQPERFVATVADWLARRCPAEPQA